MTTERHEFYLKDWALLFAERREPLEIFGRFNLNMQISGSFSVVVNPGGGGQPLAMNPLGGNLPNENQGSQSTDKVCDISGGVKPYSFAVSAGSLPPGMQLTATDNADGSTSVNITGAPTQSGAFSFTLSVSDSAGANSAVKVGA